MSPDALYKQIGILISQKPPIEGRGTLGEEELEWLARAFVLIEEGSNILDIAAARAAMDQLGAVSRPVHVQAIKMILYRTLARAELNAPASSQGAFINVGATFTAFQAVAKVLGSATSDILIVDPFLSVDALFDFVPTAPANVSVRLLADAKGREINAALRTGVNRWQMEFGESHPLQARCTTPGKLHDRLVIIDNSTAWTLTQSLKDLASRSPASLIRAESDIATSKIEAYATLWDEANQL